MTPDFSLVERIAAGDSQAERQLYKRHSGSLYALAFGLLWDPDDADRVVTETFDRARHDAREFDPARGAAFSWLTHIARSCAHRSRRASLLRARAIPDTAVAAG